MNDFGKFFTIFLKVCEFLNSFSEFWSQFCWNFRTFDTLYRKLDKFLSNSCKNFRFPCFWASLNLLGPRNSCEICRKLKKGPEPIQKPTKFQKILKNLSKSFKNSVFFEKSFENFQKLTKNIENTSGKEASRLGALDGASAGQKFLKYPGWARSCYVAAAANTFPIFPIVNCKGTCFMLTPCDSRPFLNTLLPQAITTCLVTASPPLVNYRGKLHPVFFVPSFSCLLETISRTPFL